MRTYLSLSVFALFCTLGAFGQSMIPNYSSYASTSRGTDGIVHVTETITGYTQCSPTCPVGFHQPHIAYKVKNVNTGVIEQNQTVSLGSYGPAQNINVSWTVNIQPTDPCLAAGFQCEIDFTGTVFCTVIGNNLYNGTTTKHGSIKTAYWGPPVTITNDVCYYGSLACTAGTHATCPNGTGVTFVPACPAYVKADWLVMDGGQCVPPALINAATGPGPCN
jgi:hypothetical protein